MRIALSLLLAGCTTAPIAPSTAPIGDVPLVIARSSSGATRFAAEIQIGDNAPFLALVDTGSSGLRVLPGAATFAETSSTLVSFSYHSGLALAGVVATDTVTLGGLTTPPIPIMAVEEVGCTPAKPDCADADAFGYQAVLGIGMRNLATSGGIANPIAQLAGHPAFEIDAAPFGDDTGAILRIAPDERRYTTTALPALDASAPLADGTPTWDDRTIATCVGAFCSGAILDTGCTQTELEWATHVGDDTTWPSGTEAAVTIGTLGGWDVTVDSPPVAGVDKIVEQAHTGTNLINLGTAVFFRYDVLFDQVRGAIGLAAK